MGDHAGPREPRPSRRGRGHRRPPGGGPARSLLLAAPVPGRDPGPEPDPEPLDLLPHRTRVTIRPRDEPPPFPWHWWRRHLAGAVAVILWCVVLAVIFWPR
jgi:hypothetical protein